MFGGEGLTSAPAVVSHGPEGAASLHLSEVKERGRGGGREGCKCSVSVSDQGKGTGREGGQEGGQEGGPDDTHLIKLVGGYHGERRHNQVGGDTHPLLRLLSEIKEANLVVKTFLLDQGPESEGLLGRHAVRLGQEGNERHLGGDGLGEGRREGGREGKKREGGREGVGLGIGWDVRKEGTN